MKVLTRKTIGGTEYWDNEGKKTLFVPTGEEPPFEVTTEYDSLILKKNSEGKVVDGVVTGVDLASGEDLTTNTREPGDGTNLEDLNTEQLLAFAKQIDINVPGNMKKEETIRKYINDTLEAADDV